MTDRELAMEIAKAILDEADLCLEEASIAERRALDEWQEAHRLYDRVEAGDPEAIRQVLEEQQ
jgi:uncharacterized protein YdaT